MFRLSSIYRLDLQAQRERNSADIATPQGNEEFSADVAARRLKPHAGGESAARLDPPQQAFGSKPQGAPTEMEQIPGMQAQPMLLNDPGQIYLSSPPVTDQKPRQPSATGMSKLRVSLTDLCMLAKAALSANFCLCLPVSKQIPIHLTRTCFRDIQAHKIVC